MTASISPVLHYSDLAKASEFLQEAFGFVEKVAHKGPDGAPVFVELTLEDCTIGIGGTGEPGSPFEPRADRRLCRDRRPRRHARA